MTRTRHIAVSILVLAFAQSAMPAQAQTGNTAPPVPGPYPVTPGGQSSAPEALQTPVSDSTPQESGNTPAANASRPKYAPALPYWMQTPTPPAEVGSATTTEGNAAASSNGSAMLGGQVSGGAGFGGGGQALTRGWGRNAYAQPPAYGQQFTPGFFPGYANPAQPGAAARPGAAGTGTRPARVPQYFAQPGASPQYGQQAPAYTPRIGQPYAQPYGQPFYGQVYPGTPPWNWSGGVPSPWGGNWGAPAYGYASPYGQPAR